jgi:hypothetical protein
MASKIVPSFDNLPLELRKQIFDYVWGSLCYETVLQEWENNASRRNVKHLLFKFFNKRQNWTVIYTETSSRTKFEEVGFTNKIASIYLRHPRIEGIQQAKDFILQNGLNGLVLWGLLTHEERKSFIDYVRIFTNINGFDVGFNGIISVRVTGDLTRMFLISRF